MAQKVIVPQKKNYVPQFFKQQDINSYFCTHHHNCKRKLFHLNYSISIALLPNATVICNDLLCMLFTVERIQMYLLITLILALC